MRPTTSTVAVAWMKSAGVTRCGTELPDHTGWGGTTWAQVGAWVGGNPHVNIPLRRPVVQINCWGARDDGRALWTDAEQLADTLLQACWGNLTGAPRLITTPAGFTHNAKIASVVARTEIRRHPGDVDRYAHLSFDVQLYWLAVPKGA